MRSFFITSLEAYSASLVDNVPYSLKGLRSQGSWQTTISEFIESFGSLASGQAGITIEGPLIDPRSKCPFAERGDLVLRWDGEVSPCLPLLYDRTIHIDSWVHKQFSHSLGNIRNRSLKDTWIDREYTQLREHLLNKDFSPCLGCRDCWLSEDNRLDFMGFEHPTCGRKA